MSERLKHHPISRIKDRALGVGLAAGLAFGGGASAVLSSPELPTRAPLTSEFKKKPKDGKQAKRESKEKSTNYKEALSRKELVANFRKFFNLGDNDIEEWARQTNSVIYNSGAPWGFPIILPYEKSSVTNMNDQYARITYNDSFTIDTNPHISLVAYDTDAEAHEFAFVNLGTRIYRLNASKAGGISVTFAGIQLPKALGGNKLILPVITTNIDPDNPELQKAPLNDTGSKVYYGNIHGINNVDPENVKFINNPVGKDQFLDQLNDKVGQPLLFITQLGNPNSSVEPLPNESKYSYMSAPVRNLYQAFQTLLEGDFESFINKVTEARENGLIIDQTNLKTFLRDSFTNFEEAYNRMALVYIVFPELKSESILNFKSA